MMNQAVTINLPEAVYLDIKRRAAQTRRSIEDEVLEILTTSTPEEELPSDLANAVAALNLLDDKTLWQAARTHLPAKSSARMERLHYKRQSASLTDAEEQELAALLKEYEKSILIRSEAMGILMERGYDVSKLMKKQA